MKTLKPRGVPYSRYKPGLESLLDHILYFPPLQRKVRQKIKTSEYHRFTKGVLGIFKGISRIDPEAFHLNYIAQSHMDAAWKWTVHDSLHRVYYTFGVALEHIENFPYFIFSQTSPQYYAWIKEFAPSIWRRVKEQVAARRFELTGGCWVEPDLNMPCGEALVRQRMYGMHYYQREFGHMPTVASLLDVFGFPQQVPQIFAKSGAETFWTTKCTWNDENRWPFANFLWEGQDGTRLFTHQFKFNVMAFADLNLYKKMARFPEVEAHGQKFTSWNTLEDFEQALSDDYYKRLGLFYGYGDGARGPLEVEIGAFQSLCQLGYGKFMNTYDYFEAVKNEVGDRLVVWADEMYLEFHRGCQTTQVKCKQYNRQGENWLIMAEKLVSLLNLNTSPQSLKKGLRSFLEYDKEALFKAWRNILFNQFHDILPGSSVEDVYLRCHAEQLETINWAQAIIIKALQSFQESADQVVVFNPSSWMRSALLQIDNKFYLIPEVAPFAIASFNKDEVKFNPFEGVKSNETESAFILENAQFRIKVGKYSGYLKSVFQKDLKRECLLQETQGARIRIFGDKPSRFPAWNIERRYPLRPIESTLEEVSLKRNKATGEMSIYTAFKSQKTTYSIEYFLNDALDFIGVKLDLDLRDKEIIVKYFVPLNVKSTDVVTEMNYGHCKRSRAPTSEMQNAKWEFPMHKWVDVSDSDFGVTILNKDRYGASVTRQGVYITLARTPKYPDDPIFPYTQFIPKKHRNSHTDLEHHQFELGIYPHQGPWRDAQLWQKGEEFNCPLPHSNIDLPHPSSKLLKMPESEILSSHLENAGLLEEGFLTLSDSNLKITAIKAPEKCQGNLVQEADYHWDGKTVFLRLVEFEGKDGVCTITLNERYEIHTITETDLLERPVKEIGLNSPTEFKVQYGHHEIKTLRIMLK